MSEKGELRLKLVNQTVEAMAKSVPFGLISSIPGKGGSWDDIPG